MADVIEVVEERTDDRLGTGCWAQCGRRIQRDAPRVRVKPPYGGYLLFHPECYETWKDSE